MKDYLEDAKNWLNDSADISAEQLEAVIETLGFKLRDAVGISAEHQSSIREAIEYLNTQLSMMVGKSQSEGVAEQAAPPVGSGQLDTSPLIPLSDDSSPELSSSEKEVAVAGLLNSGLIQRGSSRL